MNGRSGTLSIDNFGGVGGGIHALPQGTALIARDIGPAEMKPQQRHYYTCSYTKLIFGLIEDM